MIKWVCDALKASIILVSALLLAGCGSAPVTHYEAEDAKFSGGGFGTDHKGYSGSGFWCWVGQQGSWLEFSVSVAESGSKNIVCRYANGGPDGTESLYVNGTKIRQLPFASTKSWDVWADRVDTVTLNAGKNTIRYQVDAGDTGNINIDFIEIKTP